MKIESSSSKSLFIFNQRDSSSLPHLVCLDMMMKVADRRVMMLVQTDLNCLPSGRMVVVVRPWVKVRRNSDCLHQMGWGEEEVHQQCLSTWTELVDHQRNWERVHRMAELHMSAELAEEHHTRRSASHHTLSAH